MITAGREHPRGARSASPIGIVVRNFQSSCSIQLRTSMILFAEPCPCGIGDSDFPLQ
jgi:hypothetical protein